MNIYVDLIARGAVTSPTDATPAVRPDLRAPTTYPINLYFLRDVVGVYNYIRFLNSVITLSLRSVAPVEIARFTLAFRGAETGAIDTRFSAQQITSLLEALPTVGVGNVEVTKGDRSLTVEFTGALAGMVLPSMTARVLSSTPAGAELGIEILPITYNESNSRQRLSLRRAALAQTATWTEVTVGTTPGWAGTLNTTAVPVSAWDNPVDDLVLEVKLTALAVRGAADGATATDGVGRSGADGQIVSSAGQSGQARITDNGDCSFLVAADSSGVYGRKFVPNDIGRKVVNFDGFLYPDTTITEVINDSVTSMARLSQRCTPEGIGLSEIIAYTLTALPTDVYYSATANFTEADVGHAISGTNIPTGARIIAIINAQHARMSQPATAVGVSLSWTIASEISMVFTSGSGVFAAGDVGATLRASAVLDGDATITKFISPTQVELDRRPKATATGVTWQVIPVVPYPPALVSRLITGSSAAQEVQKIALVQAPTGGKLTIQDGYGDPMPLVALDNPVSGSGLQKGLKQGYSNFGDLNVEEVIPGAEWNVIFGIPGAQRLLLVNEDQSTYEGALLSWIVADAAQPSQKSVMQEPASVAEAIATIPPVAKYWGIAFIGADPANPSAVIEMGTKHVSRLTDGTNARMVRRRVMTFTNLYVSPQMNDLYPNTNFYFVGEEGGQERNGLYTVDWVYVTKPANRIEKHNQQRTVIYPLRQYIGATVADIQLVSTSVSTEMDVWYTYYLQGSEPATPNDSPIGVVVHYSTVGGIQWYPTLWAQNQFHPTLGTWSLRFHQSWSRRRWMGHIWEQKINVN